MVRSDRGRRGRPARGGRVPPRAGRPRRGPGQGVRPYVWLLPALAVIAVTLVYPLVQSMYSSLFRYTMADPGAREFVGFGNYGYLLRPGSEFWSSLTATGWFTVVSVVLEVSLGLALALAINEVRRSASLARTVILLPMMLTPIAVALIWKMLLNGEFGFLNYVLSVVGIDGQQWLADPGLALPSVILVEVWQNTSYAVLIFVAALQGIPEELREAARVDGAGWWRTTWHVVLPLLRKAILIVLVIRTLFVFRVFETIFVLTGGGPADSTMVLSLFIHRIGFRNFDLGLASALGWLMFTIALLTSLAYLLAFRERKDK